MKKGGFWTWEETKTESFTKILLTLQVLYNSPVPLSNTCHVSPTE